MSVLPNQSHASVTAPLWNSVTNGGGTGPTGPAGSNGPTGPTGPAGGGSSGAMRMMFWADQTNTNGYGVLAIVNQYSNVVVNNGLVINNNGTSNATLSLPLTGTYVIDVQGWICGTGNGVTRVVGSRGGVGTIYDRTKSWDVTCGIGFARYVWDGFQSNDVLEIYKNQNDGGTFTSNVSNANTLDEWGAIGIYYVS